VKEGVLFADPTTDADRQRVANSCVRNLHIAIPALIDSIGNRVEEEYTGWPDRLYLIDRAGKIRFKTEAGPFGFDAKKLAAALQANSSQR
jgi:type I thyroxine 5'-deiodinase